MRGWVGEGEEARGELEWADLRRFPPAPEDGVPVWMCDRRISRREAAGNGERGNGQYHRGKKGGARDMTRKNVQSGIAAHEEAVPQVWAGGVPGPC